MTGTMRAGQSIAAELRGGPTTGSVHRVELPGGVGMEFVWIGPGTFPMGAPAVDRSARGDEKPRREVTISRGFWLGRYAVTQEQWQGVMGTRPWLGREPVLDQPDHPAVYLSWDMAQALVCRLGERTGEQVRLPTEAEWEYACRAGTRTRWSHGRHRQRLDRFAWHAGNAWEQGLRHAQPVGARQPNPWGLHDMHGNVWEWCQDGYSGYSEWNRTDPCGRPVSDVRMYRGGSFCCSAACARSSARGYGPRGYCHFDVGVRLVWAADGTQTKEEPTMAETDSSAGYWPLVEGGTPGKRFRFGRFEAVVVTDLESTGGTQYLYIMPVYRQPEGELCLCVSSERNQMWKPGRRRRGETGGSHFLGLFTGHAHVNLGDSDEWADLDRFTEKALEVARRHIGVRAKAREVT